MKLIQSFVQQIGGKLTFGRGEAGQGAQVHHAFHLRGIIRQMRA
jgi:hypothetical protein